MTEHYKYRVTDPQAIYQDQEVTARHMQEAKEKGLARMFGCPLHEVRFDQVQQWLADLQAEYLGPAELTEPPAVRDQEHVVLMPEGSTLGGRSNPQMRVVSGSSEGLDGFLVVSDKSLPELAQQFECRHVVLAGKYGPREFFVLDGGSTDAELAEAIEDEGDTPDDCWEVWHQPLVFHQNLKDVVCW